MNLLLDTHVIIWALTDDPRLSTEARSLITCQDNVIFYSVASLWEIAIKNMKNPAKCPYHEDDIEAICEKAGFECLDITAEHVTSIRTLRTKPGREISNLDPFDRILIAQAKSEDFLLLTHDSNLANYDEKSLRCI